MMNESTKFDYKKLEKLNNPERIKSLNPDLIWETLNLDNPQILVDIGAGTGFFALLFSKKMNNGKIYACDTSEIMINWMKQNFFNPLIFPTKCEENRIPLSDETADLMYLINVYHEFEEPKKILSEAIRILKAKGKIAIIDWKVEETPEGPPLSHRISEEKVFKDIKNSGFSDIKNHNILPYHYFFTAEKQ